MNNGIRTLTSPQSVDQVVQRLTSLLDRKNIKLFALIDHSGEAAAVGLHMPATRLLIFGNPRAGTPVMISAPSAALDLPMKILISQQSDGASCISWNDPAWLQQRHGFSAELTANLAVIETLLREALSSAEPKDTPSRTSSGDKES